MDMEEIATHNDAPNTVRLPPQRRASEAGVDVGESADVDTIIEQLKKRHGKNSKAKSRRGHDFDKNECKAKSRSGHDLGIQNEKQNHEAVMTLAKQNHDKITATLGATLFTMRQENNANSRG